MPPLSARPRPHNEERNDSIATRLRTDSDMNAAQIKPDSCSGGGGGRGRMLRRLGHASERSLRDQTLPWSSMASLDDECIPLRRPATLSPPSSPRAVLEEVVSSSSSPVVVRRFPPAPCSGRGERLPRLQSTDGHDFDDDDDDDDGGSGAVDGFDSVIDNVDAKKNDAPPREDDIDKDKGRDQDALGFEHLTHFQRWASLEGETAEPKPEPEPEPSVPPRERGNEAREMDKKPSRLPPSREEQAQSSPSSSSSSRSYRQRADLPLFSRTASHSGRGRRAAEAAAMAKAEQPESSASARLSPSHHWRWRRTSAGDRDASPTTTSRSSVEAGGTRRPAPPSRAVSVPAFLTQQLHQQQPRRRGVLSSSSPPALAASAGVPSSVLDGASFQVTPPERSLGGRRPSGSNEKAGGTDGPSGRGLGRKRSMSLGELGRHTAAASLEPGHHREDNKCCPYASSVRHIPKTTSSEGAATPSGGPSSSSSGSKSWDDNHAGLLPPTTLRRSNTNPSQTQEKQAAAHPLSRAASMLHLGRRPAAAAAAGLTTASSPASASAPRWSWGARAAPGGGLLSSLRGSNNTKAGPASVAAASHAGGSLLRRNNSFAEMVLSSLRDEIVDAAAEEAAPALAPATASEHRGRQRLASLQTDGLSITPSSSWSVHTNSEDNEEEVLARMTQGGGERGRRRSTEKDRRLSPPSGEFDDVAFKEVDGMFVLA